MRKSPVLAVTMGDPAGIGPEITVKGLINERLRGVCVPIVIGDVGTLQREMNAAEDTDSRLSIKRISSLADVESSPTVLNVFQPGEDLPSVPAGVVSAVGGDAAYRYVCEAAALARAGLVDGIVTAPLNKEALHAAGHAYPGHTELLGELFETRHVSLVLWTRELSVFHVTTHMSLRQACDELTTQRVAAVIKLADQFLSDQSGSRSIGVMGLNPHAGEGGLFGTEDRDVIEPAVRLCAEAGVNVVGPLPGDAAFPQAVEGRYRGLVAMYHDQGHLAFKTVYGDVGVNVTVGLPVVRTSVDHGTAFDIAGLGIARPDAMISAVLCASELAPRWAHAL